VTAVFLTAFVVGTMAGLDSIGSGIVAITSSALLLLVIYRVVLPYLRRRKANSPPEQSI
jgi:hypothetical protein